MKPAGNRNSTLATILQQFCEAWQAWEDGASLQQAVPASQLHGSVVANVLATTMRRLAAVDWLLDQHSHGRIRKRLRLPLRWALTEMLYLDAPPPPLLIDTCVHHVRRRASQSEAGFANALLRRLADTGAAALEAQLQQQAPAAVRLNLSPALYKRWQQRFSAAELQALSTLLLQPPTLVARRRISADAPLPPGLQPLPGPPQWAPSASLFVCTDTGAFLGSDAMPQHKFYIQDPSTLLAPQLLQVAANDVVADFCAAPGGKTVLLAEQLTGADALLFSFDRSWRRLQRIRENLWQPQSNCVLAVADATAPPLPPQCLDALLLDVPCSNTGVLRRRPDVRWRFSEKQLSELVILQRQILAAGADCVRIGGRVVYSTCSIEPEENQQQVQLFLHQHRDFTLEHEQQLLPTADHDGAYAARLRRN